MAFRGRDGSAACQVPHLGQAAASWPGSNGTAAPHEAHGRSGTSTKRTARPQDGHAPRGPETGTAAPQRGQAVVSLARAGRRGTPSAAGAGP